MQMVLAVELHIDNHVISVNVEVRKVFILLISDLNVSVVYGFSKESPVEIYCDPV